MTIWQIAAMILLAVLVGRLRRARTLALLATSVAIMFWLQPETSIRSLGYWLPFGTLALTVLGWEITSDADSRSWKRNWKAAATVAFVAGLAWGVRWIGPAVGRPILPPGPRVFLLVGVTVCGIYFLVRGGHKASKYYSFGLAVLIVGAFLLVKTPDLAVHLTSSFLSPGPNTDVSAVGRTIPWLGFSYVAFRILHTVRDRHSGQLHDLDLGEYVSYVIFFPAFTAGPIDRAERFIGDLRHPPALQDADWLEAGRRLILGLFKKFVIADLLAVISISDVLLSYVRSPVWAWIFLYAYALRIYFDFSGYTDVAIGMGRLIGVKLPENFDAPYLKHNIAMFWNSWHISLTQWFRAYVFNPLTRQLRSGALMPPTWLAILITQVSTMVLIGLWHGVTWGFALWGLWHGLGLFVHNRWTALTRGFWARANPSPALQRAGAVLGMLATFHYVTIGWLFFTLSSPFAAWKALRLLVGTP